MKQVCHKKQKHLKIICTSRLQPKQVCRLVPLEMMPIPRIVDHFEVLDNGAQYRLVWIGSKFATPFSLAVTLDRELIVIEFSVYSFSSRSSLILL